MSAVKKLSELQTPTSIHLNFWRLDRAEQIETLKDYDLSQDMLFSIVTLSSSLPKELFPLIAMQPSVDANILAWLTQFADHDEDLLREVLRSPKLDEDVLRRIAKLGLTGLSAEILTSPICTEEIRDLCVAPKLYFSVSQFSLPEDGQLYADYMEQLSGSFTKPYKYSRPVRATIGEAVYRVNQDDTMTIIDSKWDSSD
jgi:hypothetical protein